MSVLHTRVIYTLVGVSAVYQLFTFKSFVARRV
jgi:uncharacterized membrane protein YuzA (DUF378 family)